MLLGLNKRAERFEFDDLQLLDGPPMRGTRTVVNVVPDALGVAGAAFIVFDDLASEAVVREMSGSLTLAASYALAGSLAADLRMTLAPQRVSDLTRNPSLPERTASGAGALMAAPVFAPDGRAAGMLIALDRSPRLWGNGELKQLEDLAHLISQEVMLRASFATLGILARERTKVLA